MILLTVIIHDLGEAIRFKMEGKNYGRATPREVDLCNQVSIAMNDAAHEWTAKNTQGPKVPIKPFTIKTNVETEDRKHDEPPNGRN